MCITFKTRTSAIFSDGCLPGVIYQDPALQRSQEAYSCRTFTFLLCIDVTKMSDGGQQKEITLTFSRWGLIFQRNNLDEMLVPLHSESALQRYVST